MSLDIITYRNKATNEYIVFEIPYNIFHSPNFNVKIFKKEVHKIYYKTTAIYYNDTIKYSKVISLIDILPF